MILFFLLTSRCPVDEKLISSFQGTWTNDGVYETQVYAYMKAFRFTGSPALYLECEVRMCHGYCPVSWHSAIIIGDNTRTHSYFATKLTTVMMAEILVPCEVTGANDDQFEIARRRSLSINHIGIYWSLLTMNNSTILDSF
jgi:hypothetical protein